MRTTRAAARAVGRSARESVTNSAASMGTPCSRSASALRVPTRWSANSIPDGVSIRMEAESRS